MNEEITASYTIDTAIFRRAFKWNLQRVTRWKWLALLVVSSVISAGTVISWDLPDKKPLILALVVFVMVGLGCIIWYVGMMLLIRFNQTLQIKRIPAYGMTLHYTVTEAGLRSTVGELETFLPWNLVLKSMATPDGVLVYPQSNMFNWLPKTAFASESDYDRFLHLISAKTKHSKIG